jgi:probable HAF family extracellular repeat protein
MRRGLFRRLAGWTALLVVAGVLAPAAAMGATQFYSATDAVDGGYGAWDAFVNPNGQLSASVTGFDNDATWAFLYTAGNDVDLEEPTGCDPRGGGDCDLEATSVNGTSQVSGFIDTYSGNTNPQAYRYDNATGKTTFLPVGTKAWYVNAQGQLIGQIQVASGATRGFLWDGKALHTMGTLGGAGSIAYAGISKNQAVGCAQTKSGAWHVMQYSGGGVHDLGLPPGLTSACAYAEGPDGTIIGGETPGPWPLYEGVGDTACDAWYRTPSGVYHTISPPSGSTCINAKHVNAADQITGRYGTNGYQLGHTYVLQNGVFQTITNANVPFDDPPTNLAYDISGSSEGSGNNASGQLAVLADDAEGVGQEFALLLTPITVTDNLSPKIAYSGSWSTTASSGAFGKSLATANIAGASATFSFSGKTFSMIAPTGPSGVNGTYRVDGGVAQQVTENISYENSQDRQHVITLTFPSVGRHMIKITAGGAGFALDAFTVAQE